MKKTRQAAQKKENKRRTFFLFYSAEQFIGFLFFIIIVTISGCILYTVKNWIDNPERVVLSQLTITGDSEFTHEEDIRKAIMGLGLPNTYIGQDVDAVQREIMRLPWIKQVSVRKQWPDRLIVHLVEYHSRYVWNTIFLLDENATVFSAPIDELKNQSLPNLFGPVGKEHFILETYKKLESLSTSLSNRDLILSINMASADERNAWTLVVKPCINSFCVEDQSIKVILGREKIIERYAEFLQLFPKIQARIPEDERIIEADLRYDNGIAIKKIPLNNINNN